MSLSLRLGIALAAALCAPAGAAPAPNVGVATAVLPAARGTPPAENARILHVGVDLVANERVETDADGKAHLIFLDGTALTIGPNSDLVLDEYLYDPDQGVGRLSISMSRGVLRFVGGGISKKTPVQVRAGTATMGIRGGIAIVEVGEQVTATFLFGTEMTLTGGGVTRRVDRPGFQIATDPSGVPQNPTPVEPQRLTSTLVALESSQAADGPDGQELTDDDIADTQIELLNSTGGLGEVEPAAGPGNAPPPPAPPPSPGANDMALLAAQFAAQSPAENEDGDEEDEETPPAATPPGPNPGTGGVGTIVVNPPPNPGLPTSGRTLPGAFTGFVQAAGDVASGGLTLVGGQFVNGVFMAETSDGRSLSLIEVDPGEIVSGVQPFGPGMLSGTAQQISPQFLLFNLVDEAGQRVFAFAGQATSPQALPQTGVSVFPLLGDFVSGQTLPFVGDVGQGAAPGRAYIAWDDAAPGARRAFGGGAIAVFGQGAAQQSASAAAFGEVLDDGQGRPHVRARLFGQRSSATGSPLLFSGGLSSSDAGDGADLFGTGANFVLESSEVDAADDVLSRGLTQSLVGGGGATTVYGQHPTGQAATQQGARASRSLTGFAGGVERQFTIGANGPTQNAVTILSSAGDPRSGVTISTRADLNTLSATFSFLSSAENVDIGFGESAGGGSAFIDDQTFFAGTGASSVLRNGVVRAGEYALITASELQHEGLLPAGVSFCACEHLTWGFFGGARNITPSGGLERWRSLELATWVAGAASAPGQLTGAFAAGVQSASYQGHIVGTVAPTTTGATYLAVGGLTVNVGFAPGAYQIQSVAISNFDGNALTGGSAQSFTANDYSVGVATAGGAPLALTGTLRGAFYGPGTPPENTAGAFSLQAAGAGYRAAGTFAAARPSGP